MTSHVTIVGGGIASLLLAVELRTRAPHVEVMLIAAEEERGLGGHLHSFDQDGYPIEHGFHALFEFYTSARRLLDAHGLLDRFVRAPDHVWVHDGRRLRKVSNGLRSLSPPVPPRVWLSSLGGTTSILGALVDAARSDEEVLSRLDAIDWRDALRAFGLGDGLASSSVVRMFYDFGFVGDGPLSARVALTVMQRLYAGGRMLHFPGPSKDVLIDPLVDRARALGVHLRLGTRLETIVLDARAERATHVHVRSHDRAEVLAVDELVVGVDVESFKRLGWSRAGADAGVDAAPRFARDVRALEGLVSLSAQAFFAGEDPVPPEIDQVIGGLPEPFSTLCPATRVRSAGRGPSSERRGWLRGASVRGTGVPEAPPPTGYELIACGPETGFEDASDEALRRRFLDTLALVGIGTPASRERAHVVVRRNRAPHERYLATRPGELALRPEPVTPLANLGLVGAWTRVPFSTPSVEAAAQSVERVRDAILARARPVSVPSAPRRRTPIDAPPYPAPPYRHEGESRIVRLRASASSLAAWLPDGVVPAPSFEDAVLLFDSRYEARSLSDPSAARFLSQEVMLAAVVRHRRAIGLFPLVLYLDDDVATMVGREVYGFPKRLAVIARGEHGVRVTRAGLPPGHSGLVAPLTLLDLSFARTSAFSSSERADGWLGRGLGELLARTDGFYLYNAARTHPEGLVRRAVTRARAHHVSVGTPRRLEDVTLSVGDAELDPLGALVEAQRVDEGVIVPLGFTVAAPELVPTERVRVAAALS